jgi:hypothetical protein
MEVKKEGGGDDNNDVIMGIAMIMVMRQKR